MVLRRIKMILGNQEQVVESKFSSQAINYFLSDILVTAHYQLVSYLIDLAQKLLKESKLQYPNGNNKSYNITLDKAGSH